MYHTAALGNTAYAAYLAAHGKFHRYLLEHRVGGHNTLCRVYARLAAASKLGNEKRHTYRYGCYIKALTDNARGGNYNVLRSHRQIFCHKIAHFFRYLYAVCVAGVGVAAVADNSLCLTV